MRIFCLFIFTLLIASSNPLFACYNDYYTLDKKGNFHLMDLTKIKFVRSKISNLEQAMNKAEEKLKTNPSKEILSDYALLLIDGGKIKEALTIYEALVKKFPNEYELQANLGTTYELVGNNEAALEHIKLALKLNPSSHGGSEWIHVRILEAKIAMGKDPKYLQTHTILRLTAAQEEDTKVAQHLLVQLKERFQFCPPPDAVMADLFEDLGDCYLNTSSFEVAKALYFIAKDYNKDNVIRLDKKIEEARYLRGQYKSRQTPAPTQAHGTSYTLTGIPMSDLIQIIDREKPVDWSKVNSDPNSLLNYLGLADPKLPVKTTLTPAKGTVIQCGAKTIPSRRVDTSGTLVFYLAGIILVISGWFAFRELRSNTSTPLSARKKN